MFTAGTGSNASPVKCTWLDLFRCIKIYNPPHGNPGRQPIFPQKCTVNPVDSSFFQKNALETQSTAHFSRKTHWKLSRQPIFSEKFTVGSVDSPFFQKNSLSAQSTAHFSRKMHCQLKMTTKQLTVETDKPMVLKEYLLKHLCFEVSKGSKEKSPLSRSAFC
ncbi:MAG: hypothetical protein RR559_08535, partial [Bacteroides sp.]